MHLTQFNTIFWHLVDFVFHILTLKVTLFLGNVRMASLFLFLFIKLLDLVFHLKPSSFKEISDYYARLQILFLKFYLYSINSDLVCIKPPYSNGQLGWDKWLLCRKYCKLIFEEFIFNNLKLRFIKQRENDSSSNKI